MELNEKIAALESENAQLRKDKERLDWIEGNQGKIGIGDHVPITTIGDTAWMATFRDDLTVVVKTSYRECVDAAIAREKENA